MNEMSVVSKRNESSSKRNNYHTEVRITRNNSSKKEAGKYKELSSMDIKHNSDSLF